MVITRSKSVKTLVAIFALVIAGFAFAHAGFNREINYQGKLAGNSNMAVADGYYNVRFKLYTAPTGGSPIWTETLCKGTTCSGTGGSDNRVPMLSGLFSVMLGSTTPFTGIDFDQTLYLGVEVGGSTASSTWDGEMLPRKIIGAVPAAFIAATSTYATTAGTSSIAISANTLQGFDYTHFLRSDTQNATSSTSTFINVLQSGVGKIAEFFSSAANSALAILSNGFVGIGSSTPSSRFSIQDNSGLSGSNPIFTIASSSAAGTGTTTLLTVLGNGNISSAGNITAAGTTTAGGLSVGTLGGLLWGTNGAVSAVSTSSLGLVGSSTLLSYVPYTGATTGLNLGSQLFTTTGNTSLANSSTTMFTSTGATYLATLGGNVGIGSTSPLSTLSVSGIAGTNPFTVASSTGNAMFTVLQNGNVGMGTANPLGKLDVRGGKSFFGLSADPYSSDSFPITVGGGSEGIAINTTAPVSSTSGLAIGVAVTGDGYLRTLFYSNGNMGFGPGNATRDIYIGRTSQNTFGVFGSYDGTGTGNMYISGSIGIGTSTPSNRLEVSGNTFLGGNLTATGTLAVTSTTTTGGLSIGTLSGLLWGTNGAVSAVSTSSLGLVGSSTLLGYVPYTGATTGLNLNTQTLTTTGNTSLANASTTNLSVSGQSYLIGNVGIGSTSPSSKLSIHDLSGLSGTNPLFTIASSTSTGASTSTLLAVLGNGNVGIGTSSPTAQLFIDAGTLDQNMISLKTKSANTFNWAGSGSTMKFSGSVGSFLTFSGTTNKVTADQQWTFGGGNGATIITAGGLGIGISSPTAALQTRGFTKTTITGSGNVTATTNSIAVTGTGTSFTTDFLPGDSIKIGTSTTVYTVASISSDTSLTLTSNYTGSSGTTLAAYNDGDVFAVDAGNAKNRLTLNKFGFLGLGTSSPSSKFAIHDASGLAGTNPIFMIASSTFANTATSTLLAVLGNGNLFLSGNFGLGTTSASNRLEVFGNTYLAGNLTATGTLAVTSTTTTGGLSVASLSGLLFGTNGAVTAVSTSSLGLVGSSTLLSYVPYTGATTGLNLNTQTLTTTGNTSLANASTTMFTSTGATYLATLGGNVGIGTTTPGANLTVKGAGGAVNLTEFWGSNVTYPAVYVSSHGTNGSGLITSNNLDVAPPSGTAISNGAVLGFNGSATNFYGIGIDGTRNSKYDVWFQTGATNGGGYRFYTGTSEKVTIDYQGNVGIGTTSPMNKLEVLGNGYFAGNLVGANITATGTLAVTSTTTTGGLSVASLSGLLFGTNGAVTAVSTSSLGLVGSSTLLSYVPYTGATTGLNLNTQTLTTTGNTSLANASTTMFTSTGATYLATLGGNVGIGTTSPQTLLSLQQTSAVSAREKIMQANVSDAGTSAFYIYNGTVSDGVFAPTFSGMNNNNSTASSLSFQGFVTSANDTGTSPVVSFNAQVSTSQTDPLNGTISALTTRPAFRWQSSGTAFMDILSNGNVGIGSTSPSAKLSIHDLSGAAGTNPLFTIASSSVTGTGTTTLLTVLGNGNVGIGTTSPASKLHISVPEVASTREKLFNFSMTGISDPTTVGGFYNATAVDGVFAPALYGFRNANTNKFVIGNMAFIGSTADVAGYDPLLYYEGDITNNSSDPFNGTMSSLVNRNIWGVGSNGSVKMVVGPTGNIGVGTVSPSVKLSVVDNATDPNTSAIEGGGELRVVGANGSANRITNISFGGTPIFSGVRANGTAASPTAVVADDQILFLGAYGYNSSAYVGNRGNISIAASENWNTTNNGTYISFSTTPNTTMTPLERMRLSQNGNVGIGTTSPTNKLEVSGNTFLGGNLTATGTLAVTSTTTTGGLSVGTLSGLLWGTNGAVTAVSTSSLGLVGSSTLLSYVPYTGATSGLNLNTQTLTTTGNTSLANASTTNLSVSGQSYLTGKVGIGSTTPSSKLSIHDLSGLAGTNPLFTIASSSATGTGTTTLLTVLGNGNVGIGTTSPASILYLYDTSGAHTTLTLDAPSGKASFLSFKSNGGQNNTTFGLAGAANQVFNGTAAGDFAIRAVNGKNLYFGIDNGSGNANPILTLNNGNVGIGTTTPASKLAIHDSSGLAGTNPLFTIASSSATGTGTTTLLTVLGNGNVGIGTTNPITKLTVDTGMNVQRFSGSSATAGAYIENHQYRGTEASRSAVVSGDEEAKWSFWGYDGSALQKNAAMQVYVDGTVSGGVVPGRIEFQTSPNSTANLATRMTISSGGNVGIGSTTPTANLSIQGTSGQSSDLFRVSSSSNITLFSIAGNTPTSNTTGVVTIWDKGMAKSSDGALLSIHADDSSPYLVKLYNDGVSATTPVFQYYANSSGDLLQTNPGNHSLQFATNGDSNVRMTITGSGNVGIGTSTPSNRLEVSGNTYLGGNLTATGTLAVTSTTTTGGLSIASLSGLLWGTNGAVTAVSTSSLVINTDNLVQGSTNLFWSNTLFDARLYATTSLPLLASLSGLSTIGSSTGQTTILGKTVMTNASTTAFTSTGSAYLATAGGNVGIGTVNPTQLLQVGSTLYVNNNSNSVGIGTTPTTGLTFLVSTSSPINTYDLTAAFQSNETSGAANTGAAFGFSAHDGSTGQRTLAVIRGMKENSTAGNYAGYLSFLTRTNGQTPAERMRIDSGGNVGIGTSTPVAKLHISDGNTVASSLYTTDYEIISAQGTAPGFNIISADSAAGSRGVFKATRARGTLASPAAVALNDQTFSLLGVAFDGTVQRATAGITFLVDGTVTNNTQAPQAITFETGTASRSEVARITSGGNFGIGSTSPSSKLTVSGSSFLGGNVIATGTLAVTSTTTTGGLSIGTLSGLLFGTNGAVSAVSTSSLGLLGSSTVSALSTNYLPKWNGSSFINSSLSDNGTTAGVSGRLNVVGDTTLGGQNLTIGTQGNGAVSIHLSDASAESAFIGWDDFYASKGLTFDTTDGNQNTRSLPVILNPYRGSVGIGTSSPSSKLAIHDMSGLAGTNPIFTIASSTSAGSATSTLLTLLGNGNLFLSGNFGLGTTSPSNRLEVSGNTFLGGNLTATGTLAVTGAATLSSTLNVTGNTTLSNASTTNFTIGTAGYLTGLSSSFLSVNQNGQIIATTSPLLSYTETDPKYTAASSTLLRYGTTTDALTEGTNNLFYTTTRFDTRLAGTTTLPNLATLSGLSTIGSSTGQTTILGKTVMTNASTTAFTSTGSAYLATAGGNVGIGNTSPSAMLDVVSNVGSTPLTYFTGGNVNSYTPVLLVRGTRGNVSAATAVQQNDPIGSFFFDGYTSTGWQGNYPAGVRAFANQSYTASAKGSYLTFETTPDNSATRGEAMRILGNGNVGIGTTSPSNKLEVAGNAYFAGNITATSTATSTFAGPIKASCFSTDGTTCISAGASLTGGVTNALTYWTGAGTVGATTSPVVGYITATSTTSTSTFSGGLTAGNNAGFVLNSLAPASSLFVAGNGNVAIGTSSPAAKLDVYGNIRLSGGNRTIDTEPSSTFGGNNGTNLTVAGGAGASSGAGSILFQGGQGSTGGNVTLSTGSGTTGGNLSISTGSGSSKGGDIAIAGGASGSIGGIVSINSGYGSGNVYSPLLLANLGGNVGIGSTSPSSKLSIHDSSGLAGTNPIFTIASSSATGTGTTTLLTVLGNGNVGIGTTTPSTKFNVYQTAAAATREILAQFNVSDAGNDTFRVSNGTSGDNRFSPVFSGYVDSYNSGYSTGMWGLTSSANDASDSSPFGLVNIAGIVSTSATDPLNGTLSPPTNRKIFTVSGGSTDIKFTIAGNGNVGIGTTTPASKLAIHDSSGLAGTNPIFTIASSSATGTGTTTLLTLLGNGNLGIGSTSPSSRLTVSGTLTVTSTTTTGGLSIASLSGLLWGTNGAVTAVSTSSLVINTDNLVQGSTNLFWSNTLFDARLYATTSLPLLASLSGLSTIGSSTGQTTILGKTVMTNASTTAFTSTGSAYLATAGGNVGVGTTQPDMALVVNGTGNDVTSGAIKINNTGTGNGAAAQIFAQAYSGVYNQQVVWGSGNTGNRYGLTKANLAEITSNAPNFAIGTTGAYPLSFITNSAVGMTMLSGGNIGIGTTSPSSKLELYDSSGANTTLTLDAPTGKASFLSFKSNGGLYQTTFGLAGASGHIFTPAVAGDFAIRAAVSQKLFLGVNDNSAFNPSMTLIPGGNVGIGTTSPTNKLEVSGNTFLGGNLTATGTLAVTSTTTTGGLSIASLSGLLWGTNGAVSAVSTSSLGLVGSSTLLSYVPYTGATSGLNLNTQTLTTTGNTSLANASTTNLSVSGQSYLTGKVGIGSTTPSSKLSIHDLSGLAGTNPLFTIASSSATGTGTTTLLTVLGNGNVGIGTTSPAEKLDVWGNLSISNGGAIVTDVPASGNSSALLIQTSNATGASGNSGNLTIKSGTANGGGTTGNVAITTSNSNTTAGTISLSTGNGSVNGGNITFSAGTGNALNGSIQFLQGNVGIGTTSPTNKLEVSGNTFLGGNLTATGTLAVTSTTTTGGLSVGTLSGLLWGTNGAVTAVSTSSLGLVGSSTLLSYVPYTGATSGLNLNTQTLTTTGNTSLANASTTNLSVSGQSYLTGKVGIGSTTPSSKLSIHDLSGLAGTNPLFTIASSSATGTGTTTLLTVLGNGNVGIGTTDPSISPGLNGVGQVRLQVANGSLFVSNLLASNAASNQLTINARGTNFAHFYSDGVVANNALNLGGSATLTGVPSSPIMTWGLSSGNVGIGTTTPSSKLAIHDSSGLAGTNRLFTIASSSVTGTGTTTLLTVLGSGNVGVGTASPLTNLSLGNVSAALGTSAMTGVGLSISGNQSVLVGAEYTAASGSTGGAFSGLYTNDGAAMGSGDRLGGFLIGGASSATTLRNSVLIAGFATENWADGSAYGSRLTFETTANGATTRTEKMTVLGNGNIGIGSSTPYSKLAIHDSSGFSGTNPVFTIASSSAAGTGTTTIFTILGNGNISSAGNITAVGTTTTGGLSVASLSGLLFGTNGAVTAVSTSSLGLVGSSTLLGYVPYTGATSGLNLGSQLFTTTGNTSLANASTTNLSVSGAATIDGTMHIKPSADIIDPDFTILTFGKDSTVTVYDGTSPALVWSSCDTGNCGISLQTEGGSLINFQAGQITGNSVSGTSVYGTNLSGSMLTVTNASTTNLTASGFANITKANLTNASTTNLSVSGAIDSTNNSRILTYENVRFLTSSSTASHRNLFLGASTGNASLTNMASADANVGIGQYAMQNLTSGSHNVALGYSALQKLSDGTYNMAIGENSLQAVVSGVGNVAVGVNALYSTTGSENVGIGGSAGFLVTGSDNTLIGIKAGQNQTSGSNNIVIGANLNAPVIAGSQQLNIGDVLFGTGMYNGAIETGGGTPVAGAKIGISSTTPSANFVIHSTDGGVGTLPVFVIASSTSTRTATTTLLSVLGNGLLTLNATGAGTSTINGNLYVNGALRSTTSYNGDIVFANNFRILEATSSPQAMIWQNQNGQSIFNLDESGNLNITGDICSNNVTCIQASLKKLSTDITSLASSTTVADLAIQVDSIKTDLNSKIDTLSSRVSAFELLASSTPAVSTSTIEAIAVATASSTASTTVAEITGSTGFIQTIATAVQNVIQASQNWVVDRFTAHVAYIDRVEAQTVAVSKGLEMADQANGSIYCVTILNGEFNRRLGPCNSATSTVGSVAVAPTPTNTYSPVISPIQNATNSTSTATSTDSTSAASTSMASDASATTTTNVTSTTTTSTTDPTNSNTSASMSSTVNDSNTSPATDLTTAPTNDSTSAPTTDSTSAPAPTSESISAPVTETAPVSAVPSADAGSGQN